ncbi:MAG TPA: hydroxymethylbilane synthase, partial [Bacteroidota bacterium]|nr:hydroxymethylbilane synthase [Bacteroidota bacterium]
LWQSRWVESELKRLYPALRIETVIIKTTGDKILDSPLSKIGDKGLFTKEIERALLDQSIDLAVHSLKDVPTHVETGLTISAVCEREDVRDVFISHPVKRYARLADVPRGGTIATSSLRRRSQLLALRPDLVIVDVRGNLRTRFDKLAESNWDGMLLAKAGVTRLERTASITEVIDPVVILPAVGQGALGIETRENDEFVNKLVSALEHAPTRVATSGERALLRRLEGGCQIPIGTLGRIEDGRFKLDAMIGSLDGTKIFKSSIEGLPEESERLGVELALKLLELGGGEVLDAIRKRNENGSDAP